MSEIWHNSTSVSWFHHLWSFAGVGASVNHLSGWIIFCWNWHYIVNTENRQSFLNVYLLCGCKIMTKKSVNLVAVTSPTKSLTHGTHFLMYESWQLVHIAPFQSNISQCSLPTVWYFSAHWCERVGKMKNCQSCTAKLCTEPLDLSFCCRFSGQMAWSTFH